MHVFHGARLAEGLIVEDVVEIRGGAIWVQPEGGRMLILGQGAAENNPFDEPLAPISPLAPANDTMPQEHVLWQVDLAVHGKIIRLRSQVPPVIPRWLARLTPLTAKAGSVPDHHLDLTRAGEGRQLWSDGRPGQRTLAAHEVIGEIYGAVLELAAAPREPALLAHVAGLVVDGRPLLLSAPSGGGKTVLTVGLAAAGAGILSDDAVAILAGDFSMVGLPVAIGIRPAGWDLVRTMLPPEAALLPPSWAGRRWAPPHLIGRVVERSGPAAAIILLDRQSHWPAEVKADWRQVDSSQGLAALIDAGAALPGPATLAAARRLAQWSDQVGFFRFRYGSLTSGVEGVHALAATLA